MENKPLRRFAISRPIKLDPESIDKYPYYKSIIYEISGVRRKWTEQINRWPPGDFMLGEIGLTIIRTLIAEGYKGKVEVAIPFYTAHNVLNYVMPRHEETTKLYHALYNPLGLALKLAKENEIDYTEYNEYPPDYKTKAHHPKFTRAKKGQTPKLEKRPPADNLPETPPTRITGVIGKQVRYKDTSETKETVKVEYQKSSREQLLEQGYQILQEHLNNQKTKQKTK